MCPKLVVLTIMPKLNYPLKAYIKAVELMAEKKGLLVNVVPNKGSVVRFELFEKNNKVPMCMWVIHHSHKGNKRRFGPETIIRKLL